MHQHSNYRGQQQQKKRKRKGMRKFIFENFPSMEKEIVNPVQEAQIIPYMISPRRNSPRHILIKLTKTNTKKEY